MSDCVERKIGDLTVRVDREACIGSGNCTKVASEVFELDADVVAVFKEPGDDIERDRVIEACSVCPVQALFAIDASGNQLVP